MAYRVLRLLTWVALGAFAVGCGSGPGPDASAPPIDEDPPASADDAPYVNYDQPPASADDAPPASADAPGPSKPPVDGGGDEDGAVGLCRKLCREADPNSCENAGSRLLVSAICQTQCQLTPAQAPCESEFADAIDCLLDVDDLCSGEPSQEELGECQNKLNDAVECSSGEGPGGPGQGEECTMADACAGCTSACDICRCAAGAQADALCADAC